MVDAKEKGTAGTSWSHVSPNNEGWEVQMSGIYFYQYCQVHMLKQRINSKTQLGLFHLHNIS